MAFIDTVTDELASGKAAEVFEADRARLGYVPNYTRLFAHRPAVYGLAPARRSHHGEHG